MPLICYLACPKLLKRQTNKQISLRLFDGGPTKSPFKRIFSELSKQLSSIPEPPFPPRLFLVCEWLRKTNWNRPQSRLLCLFNYGREHFSRPPLTLKPPGRRCRRITEPQLKSDSQREFNVAPLMLSAQFPNCCCLPRTEHSPGQFSTSSGRLSLQKGNQITIRRLRDANFLLQSVRTKSRFACAFGWNLIFAFNKLAIAVERVKPDPLWLHLWSAFYRISSNLH